MRVTCLPRRVIKLDETQRSRDLIIYQSGGSTGGATGYGHMTKVLFTSLGLLETTEGLSIPRGGLYSLSIVSD